MSDLEHLKEYIVDLKADRDATKAKEKQDAWTKTAGVSVVFVAVLAAVATQWGGKYSTRTLTSLNDATYAQARATDQWGFYQAKSIKQNLYEMAEDQEKGNPSDRTPAILSGFHEKIAKFSEEKLAIMATAKSLDEDRVRARDVATAWSAKGAIMGLSVAIFQIAIAVASISILMKRKPFWYASLALALGATLQMLRAWV